MHRALLIVITLALVACQGGKGDKKQAPVVTAPADAAAAKDPHDLEQVPAPFDVKTPPADAAKTPSGLVYKVMADGTGKAPGKNDGIRVRYTAWRQDGTTYATTQPSGTPTTMFLYSTADGFVEGMMLMKEGGKAMFWMPPELAEPHGKDLPETLAYEVELVEVIAAPPMPDDRATPPADATKDKSGVVWKKVKTAKGETPRAWDKVSLSYTGWAADGRILESSEVQGKPLDLSVEGLPPIFASVVPSLAVGERARIWIPEAMMGKHGGTGRLCFEVEIHGVTRQIKPPDAPPDVAAPPANAQKTPKGVSYVVHATGAGGKKPIGTDKVQVSYTGWTTDGKRFDSSIPEGAPREFEVGGVIAGWTDALLMMSPGDKWRIWIPEALAYKGAPQQPQGTLVFDVELVGIVEPKVQFTPPP